MTVALTRTKAEQALLELFDAAAAKLPGDAAATAARRAAIGAFTGLGLPHRRIEEWKYTDLRSALKEIMPPAVGAATPLAPGWLDTALAGLAELHAHRVVLVDGAYRAELSSPAAEGVSVASLAASLAGGNAAMLSAAGVPGQEAVVALNAAFVTDGAVVQVAADAVPTKPLLIVCARASREPSLITVRNRLDIGPRARVTVIEAHIALPDAAPGQANALTEVSLHDGASLVHAKCTLEGGARATHLGSWLVSIGAGAQYRPFQLTAATGLVRHHLAATFAGEGGKIDAAACFLGRGAEHIDTTMVIDHAVPGCTSRELVKGVLAGTARGIFQGKVIVRPNAQKTDGKQMAQALMLSEEAEFDSKPELEIFADDVVCGHGSTAAQLDEDMLFYLRSRGIPLAAARALLIESFVGEAFDKLDDERLREALWGIAKANLAGLVG